LEIIYFYLNMLCLAGSKNKIIDKLIENWLLKMCWMYKQKWWTKTGRIETGSEYV
jgi:hypothetical protein